MSGAVRGKLATVAWLWSRSTEASGRRECIQSRTASVWNTPSAAGDRATHAARTALAARRRFPFTVLPRRAFSGTSRTELSCCGTSCMEPSCWGTSCMEMACCETFRMEPSCCGTSCTETLCCPGSSLSRSSCAVPRPVTVTLLRPRRRLSLSPRPKGWPAPLQCGRPPEEAYKAGTARCRRRWTGAVPR